MGRERLIVLVMACVLGSTASASIAQTPPAAPPAEKRVVQGKPEKPTAPIFEEGVSDEALIARLAAAAAEASKRNKRVLLVWGRNDSKWCRMLDARLNNDLAVSAKMNAEYVTVMIDVGADGDQHSPLAQLYNADIAGEGVPYLTILDTSLTPAANMPGTPLENKYQHINPGYSSAELIKFFQDHQTARQDAARLTDDAFARAKREDKDVLMYFRGNSCPWCDKLEAWLDRDDVRPILEQDLVIVGIDADRMTQGPEVAERFIGGLTDALPWMLVMNADKAPLATANMPSEASRTGTQNIGFPQADDERAHMGAMLTKAKKRMTDEQIKAVVETLKPTR